MRFPRLIVCGLFLVLGAGAQADSPDLDWYLPWAADYDSDIPTPEDVFGWQVGEWHVSHDQLVRYFEHLAAASDRVSLEERGRTYEDRPMLVARITSPGNQEQLESVRQARLEALESGSQADATDHPLVTWLGYSIHGDEASGSNAAMVVAWHLAAARDDRVAAMLEDTVILLEPSMNPDGLQRFSTWVNMHRGQELVADPQNREHQQGWPRARTNHYWFDLNRDWLPVQHPESRARVSGFHAWKPNVVGDWHEMGRNSTYFFQPGDPDRNNPRTPERNFDLTGRIAAYHGETLDQHGELYYSRESFDDYYYGKGSTFPDINGSVGILFEQGSSRGHLQETIHGGERHFSEAIRNQVLTSFSTLQGSYELRDELRSYQKGFFEQAMAEADEDERAGFVIGGQADRARTVALVELLIRQDVRVQRLEQAITVDGQRFEPGNAWLVPLDQPQYRFILAMLERQLTFPATRFYDVSTWTLPLAFNVPIRSLSGGQMRRVDAGEALSSVPSLEGGVMATERQPVAWAFEWSSYYAPRLAQRLLEADARLRVATRPFTARTAADGDQSFSPGSILVPTGIQDEGVNEEVRRILRDHAADDGVSVAALTRGLTSSGIDLGSPSFEPVETVRPMILVGDGVSMYEAGEIWHLLDQRFGIPVTLMDREGLDSAELSRYTHIFMVNGRWDGLGDSRQTKIHDWVRGGGTLVAQKSAVQWVSESGLHELEFAEVAEDEAERLPYGEFGSDRAAQVIGGAIFETSLDLTHPLAYGYTRESLPVFRNSTRFLQPGDNPYTQVARYTEEPRLSGYVSDRNREALSETVSVTADRVGAGRVVLFVDNPAFRAFWYGTSRMVLNSLFFDEAIGYTERQ